MNINLILTLAQWSILLLLTAVHFLMGLKRGIHKTVYYLLSSLLITLILFVLISVITIQPFIDAKGILDFVESFTGRFLQDDIRDIIIDPALNPILMGFIDLIIKIISLIILYPLIKWLITITLLKWFWNKIENLSFAKTNKNEQLTDNEDHTPSPVSRSFGGLFGAIRGILTAYLLLLPFLFIISAVDQVAQIEAPLSQPTSTVNETSAEIDMLNDIIEQIHEFNKQNLVTYTKNIIINDRTIEENVMNLLFNMNVVVEGTEKSYQVQFGDEIKFIGGIFGSVIEMGILEDDFDYQQINHNDDFESIETILNNTGDSKLIQSLIPILLEVADNRPEILDLLGFQPSTNEFTSEGFSKLKELDWKNDTTALLNAVDAILKIGSVEEIFNYIDDPRLFLALDNSQKLLLADAIEALGDLELLYASTIGLEYFLIQNNFYDDITWQEDGIAYLQAELAFLQENLYLQNELKSIANLVRMIFSEDFNDIDYTILIPEGEDFSFEVYLQAEVSQIFSAAMDGLIEIETVFNLLPLVVDYVVYTSDDINIEMIADDLSEFIRSESLNPQSEVGNLKSIYQLIVRMTLSEFFDGETELMDAIDHFLMQSDNLVQVRAIIDVLFTESYAVNQLIGLLSETLIDAFITDTEINELVKLIIVENDFSFGQELNTILNMVDLFYAHGSMTTITTAIEEEDYATLVNVLGNFTPEEFDTLKTHLFDLQTIKNGSIEILNLAVTMIGEGIITIPDEASFESFATDVTMLLDAVYATASYITERQININDFENIDLLRILPLQTLKDILTFDLNTHENSILMHSLINFVTESDVELLPGLPIYVPENLAGGLGVTQPWIDETNHILGGVFDLGLMILNSTISFELSINNLSSMSDLNHIPTSLLTILADEERINDGFTGITSSLLIKSNIVSLANHIIPTLSEPAIPFTFPEDYYMHDDLSSSSLNSLIYTTAAITSEFIMNVDESIGYNLGTLDPQTMIEVFNALDPNLLVKLGDNPLLNNNFRRIFVDEDLHEYFYDMLNTSLQIDNLPAIEDGLFDFEYALDENDNIKADTLTRILLVIQDLQFPSHMLTLETEALIEAMGRLVTESWVESLFDIEVLHEIVSNVIKHESVKSLAQVYWGNIDDVLETAQINAVLDYDHYYTTIINALLDANQLLSVNELNTYLRAYHMYLDSGIDFEMINQGSYNALASKVLTRNNQDENMIDVVTSSRLIRAVLGTALQDDALLDGLVGMLNGLIENVELFDLTLDKEDIRFDNDLFDVEGIKQTHLQALFDAVLYQDLDLINRGILTPQDLSNLLEYPQNEIKDRISFVYDSRIITNILENVFDNPKVHNALFGYINDQIDMISTETGITLYDIEPTDLQITFDWIDEDAVRQMTHVVLMLDIESFEELTGISSLSSVRSMLNIENDRSIVDEFVKIPLVYDLFDFILGSDYYAKTVSTLLYEQVLITIDSGFEPLPQSIFTLDPSIITEKDFADLIVSAISFNIDLDTNFTSMAFIEGLLEPVLVAGIEQDSINHLLDSRIIHHSITQMINNDYTKHYATSSINELLEERGYQVRLDVSLLELPSDVFDEDNLINPSEFTSLLEAVAELNVTDFNDLMTISNVDMVKSMVPVVVYEKLFESKLIHHVIDTVIQSEFTRSLIIEYVTATLNLYDLDFNMGIEELALPVGLLDATGRINPADITSIIEALYMTNQQTFELNIQGMSDVERILPLNAASKLFDSGLIMHYISRVLKSDSTADILAQVVNRLIVDANLGYALYVVEDFILPDYLFNANGSLVKSEIFNLIEAAYEVNIDDFSVLSFNSPSEIENIIPLSVVDLILDSNLVKFYLTQALTTSTSRKILSGLLNHQLNNFNLGVEFNFEQEHFMIPQSILDEKSLIKSADLRVIFETLYGLGIDDFSSISVNNPSEVEAIINKDGVMNLFESDLIKFVLSVVTQGPAVRSALAQYVNNQLSIYGYDAVVSDDDFQLPIDLRDENGFIKSEDIGILLDTFYGLGIDNFASISVNNPREVEMIINGSMVSHLLDSQMVMYIISQPLTLDVVRSAVADILNTQVANLGYGTGLYLASDFQLPQELLTADNMLYKSDIMALVDGFFEINLDSFSAISINSPSDAQNIMSLSAFDTLFSSRLLKFYLNQALTVEGSRDFLAKFVNNQISGYTTEKFLPVNFILPEDAFDADGYFDVVQLRTLVETFYNLGIDSFDSISFNSPAEIENIINEAAILNVYNTPIIKFALNTMIHSLPGRSVAANLINKELQQNGLSFEVTAADFQLPNHLLDASGDIKSEDLSIILQTFFSLGIDNFNSISVNSPAEVEMIINSDMVDNLLNSKLMMYIISKPFTIDALTDTLANYLNTFVTDLGYGTGLYHGSNFTLPEELFDEEQLLAKTDIMALVDGFYGLNVDSFTTITVNSPSDAQNMMPLATFDRFFESRILKFYVTQLLSVEGSRSVIANVINAQIGDYTSEQFQANNFILPDEAFTADGYVNVTDLRTLVETFYNLGINSFDTIAMNNPQEIQNIISEVAILNVYDTQLIKFYLNTVIQSLPVRSALANFLNDILVTNGVSVSMNAADFLIASSLLDESNYIKREEIQILVSSFYGLGIENFGNIVVNNPADAQTILPLDVLDNMLTSRILKYYMTKVATSEGLRNLAAEMANEQLAGLDLGVNFTFYPYYFEIPQELLDENAEIKSSDIRLFVEVFYGLGIQSWDTISYNNPSEIEEIFPLALWSKLLYETDLVHYVIDRTIQLPQLASTIASMINQMALDLGFNINLTADELLIPADALEDGKVKRTDLYNLLGIFYDLGIENFGNIEVNSPRAIENIMSLSLFEDLFDVSLVYEVINKVSTSPKVSNFVANFLSSMAADFGVDIDIPASVVNLPEIALIDGKIRKDELTKLVEILYALEVDDFAELGNISTPNQVRDLVSAEYLSHMLESEIIYYLVGYVPQTIQVRNQLASFGSKFVSQQLDLSINFIADDFLLDQHDVLITTGTYNGYIKKDEIILFYESAFTFDTDAIEPGTTIGQFNNILDELTRETDDGRMVLEVMFDSNILLTIMDRMFNLENSPHLETGVLSFIGETLGVLTGVSVELTPDDHLFRYHPSALTAEGYIAPEHIVYIITGLKALDLTDDLSLATLVDAIGRDYSADDGMDDFDRFYQSMILQSLMSNLMLSERFMAAIAKGLNASQSQIEFDNNMLAIPTTVVDESIIDPIEVKKLINVFGVLGFQDLDMSVVGIDLFLSLEGRNVDGGVDDLDRVLDSMIVHAYFDRFIKSSSFNQLVADMMNDMFDRSGGVDTSLTPDMLDEDGLFDKLEIRRMIISVKLLGVETEDDLTNIGLRELVGLDNENNDLDAFLSSHYIRVMMGRLLTSSAIKDTIADAAGFAASELTLNSVQRDAYGELEKEEVKAMVVALNILGIDDFEIDFDAGSLSALSEEELDTVLDSNYFYQVISLTLQSQLADSMTNEATVTEGSDYDGYVKKDEVKLLVEALDIIGEDDPGNIDPNNLSVADMRELLALDSKIIQKLISNELIEQIDIPAEVVNEEGLIDQIELSYLLDALAIILGSEDEVLGDADFDNLNFTTIMFAQLLNIGTDVDDAYPDRGSIIVTRMISEQVIENIENIPLDAYESEKDIKREELYALKDALFIMGINEITSSFDAESMTVGELRDVVELESLIIQRLVSDALVTEINVPEESMDEEGLIEYVELYNLIEALEVIFEHDRDAEVGSLDMQNLTFTLDMFGDLLAIGEVEDPVHGSRIVTRLISESIIENMEDQLPEDAYSSEFDVKRSELYGLRDALAVLEIEEISEDVTADDMTIAQFRDLIDIESVIIHKMISDSIVKEVDVPVESLDEDGYVVKPELRYLADALYIILGNEDASVASIDLTNNPITTDMFIGLLDVGTIDDPVNGSRVVTRMISESMISNISDIIPDEAYETEKDIKRSELYGLSEALVILDIEDVTGDDVTADEMTIAQLRDLIDIDSVIIHKMISDTIVDEVNVPDVSFGEDGYVLKVELHHLADALVVLLGDDDAKVNEVDMENTPIKTDMFGALLDIGLVEYPETGSPLVIRMISENIITIVSDLPVAAYVTDPTDEFDVDTDNDIKRVELLKLEAAFNILGIDEVSADIDASTMTIDALTSVVAVESLIIRKLVSDTLKLQFNEPDESKDSEGHITQFELYNLTAGLNLLFAGSTDTTTVDSIDMTLVTMSTSVLSNLLDIGTDVDPVNGSPLITRLISENVIEVFDDLPEDAYDGQYDIKRSELYHIVTVLDILGIGDVDGDIDVENLDADTLEEIHLLNSIIFNDIIAEAIKDAVTVPDEVRVWDDELIKYTVLYSEVGNLIKSIGILDISVSDLETFDPNEIEFDTLQLVRAQDSLIIERMISDAIISVDVLVKPAHILDNGHIIDTEIDALIDDLAQNDEFETINDFVEFIENATVEDQATLQNMALTMTSEILKSTIEQKITEILGI